MGILADFFLAGTDADAMRYPDAFLAREQWKGYTAVELSTLSCLLQRVEWHESVLDDFPCIRVIDDGEQTTQRFPDQLTAKLAALAAPKIRELAQRWSSTEELAGSDPESVHECLAAICRLAARASQDGAKLYLWNCT